MTDNRPDDLAEWDAAYILGALNSEDRRTYENYLATSPDRSAELAGLTGMPDILDVLSPEVALAAMAYTYLASGFVGLIWTRLRRRHTDERHDDLEEPGEHERPSSHTG